MRGMYAKLYSSHVTVVQTLCTLFFILLHLNMENESLCITKLLKIENRQMVEGMKPESHLSWINIPTHHNKLPYQQ